MRSRAIGELVVDSALDVAKEMLDSTPVSRSRVGVEVSKGRGGIGYVRMSA